MKAMLTDIMTFCIFFNLHKTSVSNEQSARDMAAWLAWSLFRLNYKTVDI